MKGYSNKSYRRAIFVLWWIVIIEGMLLAHLWIARVKKPRHIVFPTKGKIAIVLDDWGYNLDNLAILETIRQPLTVSILPGLAYSLTIAQKLDQRKYEIILHLPMEPHERFRLEDDTIFTSMDEATIIDIIDKDAAGMAIRGVSNHMGSKTTEDLRTMAIVLEELKKRHLYFLDSFVSPRSVCSYLSHKMRLPFAKRDIFLDNKNEPGYIRRQIHKLKTKALVSGSAVGIGHDRTLTLEVLREAMPGIEKEGYKFVFVSELVR